MQYVNKMVLVPIEQWEGVNKCVGPVANDSISAKKIASFDSEVRTSFSNESVLPLKEKEEENVLSSSSQTDVPQKKRKKTVIEDKRKKTVIGDKRKKWLTINTDVN